MIGVLEDEDDHVLEWHYTIDHVYQSKTVMKSKLTVERGKTVYILRPEENIMKFYDYLFRKSTEKRIVAVCLH